MYAILGSIYHSLLYSASMVKKKELLYQIWSLTKQTQASPLVMAVAEWFIIEGRMESSAVCEKFDTSSFLFYGFFQLLHKREKKY